MTVYDRDDFGFEPFSIFVYVYYGIDTLHSKLMTL